MHKKSDLLSDLYNTDLFSSDPFKADDSVTVPMPTAYGEFLMTVVTDLQDGKEHIVLQMGVPERHLEKGTEKSAEKSSEKSTEQDAEPIIRIHSECATGDLFTSSRCDCGEQLDHSLKIIAAAGSGVLIYLRQEGRGIGLKNKLRAYQLQDQGLDTVDANVHLGLPIDSRSYALAATILTSLGIFRVRLLTNNPEKVQSLQEFGISVSRLPIQVAYQEHNLGYMKTKQSRLGHLIHL